MKTKILISLPTQCQKQAQLKFCGVANQFLITEDDSVLVGVVDASYSGVTQPLSKVRNLPLISGAVSMNHSIRPSDCPSVRTSVTSVSVTVYNSVIQIHPENRIDLR